MATKAKKAPAKKPAAKKTAAGKAAPKRIQEKHYLPPWVVIGKTIKAAIVGVDPAFKLYTVAYFDAPSGWVQLGFNSEGMAANRRTHYNNIVIESAGN
jgi:hypothetical protein